MDFDQNVPNISNIPWPLEWLIVGQILSEIS